METNNLQNQNVADNNNLLKKKIIFKNYLLLIIAVVLFIVGIILFLNYLLSEIFVGGSKIGRIYF